MKILAVIGSGRKSGNTFLSAARVEERLKRLEPSTEFTYLFLSDVAIKACIGCRACFERGEASCPHKDDIVSIAQRLRDADGVVFASPTYVCNMSGLMKNFFDRLAYFCHRPAFHGKQALILTTTAGGGAQMAAFATRLPLGSMGFSIAGSLGLTLNTGAVVPVTAKHAKKLDALADRFLKKLNSARRNAPTVFSLVSFYYNRRYYEREDRTSYDYLHWKEKGWLEKDRAYFTDVKVSLFQKIAAHILGIFTGST